MPTLLEGPPHTHSGFRTDFDPDICPKERLEKINGERLADEKVKAGLKALSEAACAEVSEGLKVPLKCKKTINGRVCPYKVEISVSVQVEGEGPTFSAQSERIEVNPYDPYNPEGCLTCIKEVTQFN